MPFIFFNNDKSGNIDDGVYSIHCAFCFYAYRPYEASFMTMNCSDLGKKTRPTKILPVLPGLPQQTISVTTKNASEQRLPRLRRKREGGDAGLSGPLGISQRLRMSEKNRGVWGVSAEDPGSCFLVFWDLERLGRHPVFDVFLSDTST